MYSRSTVVNAGLLMLPFSSISSCFSACSPICLCEHGSSLSARAAACITVSANIISTSFSVNLYTSLFANL